MAYILLSDVVVIYQHKTTYLSEGLAEQKREKIGNIDAVHQPAYSLYSKTFTKQSQRCLKLSINFSLSKQAVHHAYHTN